MFTILAILIFCVQSVKNAIRNFFNQIPSHAYSSLSGVVFACVLVYSFSVMPEPVEPLDVNSLVKGSGETVGTANYTVLEQPAKPVAIIPSELEARSEVVYDLAEPFVIASRSLSDGYWNTFSEDTAPIADDEAPLIALDEPDDVDQPKVIPIPPRPDGIEHVVKSGENPWIIAKAYGITTSKLLYYNPNVDPDAMQPKDKIFIPGAQEAIDIQRRANNGTMRLPVRVALMTSQYGLRKHPVLAGALRFHHGVDFKGRTGDPIFAVLSGTVTWADWKGSKGKTVEITHSNGLKTVYAHTSRILVKKGQRVSRGEQIANIGATGRVTASHLHFEIWKGSKSLDPEDYFALRRAK